jgi:hypothetical protein
MHLLQVHVFLCIDNDVFTSYFPLTNWLDIRHRRGEAWSWCQLLIYPEQRGDCRLPDSGHEVK